MENRKISNLKFRVGCIWEWLCCLKKRFVILKHRYNVGLVMRIWGWMHVIILMQSKYTSHGTSAHIP